MKLIQQLNLPNHSEEQDDENTVSDYDSEVDMADNDYETNNNSDVSIEEDVENYDNMSANDETDDENDDSYDDFYDGADTSDSENEYDIPAYRMPDDYYPNLNCGYRFKSVKHKGRFLKRVMFDEKVVIHATRTMRLQWKKIIKQVLSTQRSYTQNFNSLDAFFNKCESALRTGNKLHNFEIRKCLAEIINPSKYEGDVKIKIQEIFQNNKDILGMRLVYGRFLNYVVVLDE